MKVSRIHVLIGISHTYQFIFFVSLSSDSLVSDFFKSIGVNLKLIEFFTNELINSIFFTASIIISCALWLLAKIDRIETIVNTLKTSILPKVTRIDKSQYFLSPIQNQNDTLIIYGLNGNSFIKLLDENPHQFSEIKLLIPNDEAIEKFYSLTSIVDHTDTDVDVDRNAAAQNALSRIQSTKLATVDLLRNFRNNENNRLDKMSIREIPTFPLECYCIASSQKAILGKYIITGDRNGIGLKGLVWTTNNANLVKSYEDNFHSLWEQFEESEYFNNNDT